jgi:hypothetical protein
METLEVLRQDGIVTVTMNRPSKKNAANGTMWAELKQTFLEIGSNPNDRVMVLTGAGGEFCSGADLSSGDARRAETHALASMRNITEVCMSLARIPQPTIAKVRGVAVGAGCNMALICDLVVASDTARFSEIFAKRGLSLDFGGSWVLPRRVGIHRAKELALLAEIIGAQEAERFFYRARGAALGWRHALLGWVQDAPPASARARRAGAALGLEALADAAAFQPTLLLNAPTSSSFVPNHVSHLAMTIALASRRLQVAGALIPPAERPR